MHAGLRSRQGRREPPKGPVISHEVLKQAVAYICSADGTRRWWTAHDSQRRQRLKAQWSLSHDRLHGHEVRSLEPRAAARGSLMHAFVRCSTDTPHFGRSVTRCSPKHCASIGNSGHTAENAHDQGRISKPEAHTLTNQRRTNAGAPPHTSDVAGSTGEHSAKKPQLGAPSRFPASRKRFSSRHQHVRNMYTSGGATQC